MRHYTTYETWDLFFREKYETFRVMQTSFYTLKQRDKKGVYKNKKYLESIKHGHFVYYRDDEIQAYLKHQEEVNNTITYAEQLIVDLEAIFNHARVKRWKSKFIRTLGISYQEFSEFQISYNYAVKFIAALERVIKNMSSKGRKELIMLLEEVRR